MPIIRWVALIWLSLAVEDMVITVAGGVHGFHPQVRFLQVWLRVCIDSKFVVISHVPALVV